MRTYLSDHPEIAFSEVREPNFFNTDFSPRIRKFPTIDEYEEQCFDAAADERYKAEKTVWYLYSQKALENIYTYNPDAKIIVMLRNPVEVAYSLHGKLFEIQQDDVRDFRQAWELQDSRSDGEHLPPGCPDRKILQYGEVPKFADQVERLLSVFPRQQVKFVIYDDFKEDPEAMYEAVLEFLDLERKEEKDFTPVNGSRAVRFPELQYVLRQGSKQLYQPVSSVSEAVKQRLGIKRWNIMVSLSRLNVRQESRPELPSDFRRELQDHFRSDVVELSRIIQRDLSGWR